MIYTVTTDDGKLETADYLAWAKVRAERQKSAAA